MSASTNVRISDIRKHRNPLKKVNTPMIWYPCQLVCTQGTEVLKMMKLIFATAVDGVMIKSFMHEWTLSVHMMLKLGA